ncbi:hypothetical protein ElyMa_006712400 [Elysia marginata]|uniref:Uncharacterized protein n=1 Tax=Elysia marginata TaxID=1093978 RepID=A0AAV4IRS7_9GAST|nr:hypothetical protein ElyMa_006712400 [Elysia marginata]
MSVNILSQGVEVDLPKAGLEPQTSWSESRASTTRPQHHTIQTSKQRRKSNRCVMPNDYYNYIGVHGHATSDSINRSKLIDCHRLNAGLLDQGLNPGPQSERRVTRQRCHIILAIIVAFTVTTTTAAISTGSTKTTTKSPSAKCPNSTRSPPTPRLNTNDITLLKYRSL